MNARVDTPVDTYKIFRSSGRRFTIRRGLSLQSAQIHCSDPETASTTAKSAKAKRRTRRAGDWFDGYYRE